MNAPSPESNLPLILLVEDYFANVLVADTILEGMGYRCEVANNGQEAVAIMAKSHEKFGVVLMDVQMPVMDGYTATQHIRQDEAARNLRRVPIIGLTAHALSGDREKCLNSGMDDYVAKPFNSDELQAKLSVLMGGRQKVA